jgi:hypothetical protein
MYEMSGLKYATDLDDYATTLHELGAHIVGCDDRDRSR